MNANEELRGQILPLLESAVIRLNTLDNSSRPAFEEAVRTLEGTSTEYQRTVKKHARRAESSIDEARSSLTAAIGLVEDLIRRQDANENREPQ